MSCAAALTFPVRREGPREYNTPATRAYETRMENVHGEVSLLLEEMKAGVPDAEARLLGIVYAELRKIAAYHLRRDRPGHTLQPTALVNEAYLRLAGANLRNLTNREHFFAVASRLMRRILVDCARAHYSEKRGGHQQRIELAAIAGSDAGSAEEFLSLDQALSRLATWDERQSRIVEMRFFGGLSEEEIASVLGVSVRTVKREWAIAKAWLQSQLGR